VLGWNAHRHRNQLAGNLRTCGKGTEQEIARTSGCAHSAYSLVGFGLVDRAANIH
jgi:hypothetical protein